MSCCGAAKGSSCVMLQSSWAELTWRLVASVLVHLVPGAVLLLPDDDFTVVGAGGQKVAKHRVSPSNLPHRTLVAAQTQSRLVHFMWREEKNDATISVASTWSIHKNNSRVHLIYLCRVITAFYPLRSATSICPPFLTSKILTVRSEEQVARRVP